MIMPIHEKRASWGFAPEEEEEEEEEGEEEAEEVFIIH